jgi:hypothetical protein
MIRNTTLFSLIVIVAANSCFAGKNHLKQSRIARTESAGRLGNGYNRMLDDKKRAAPASKKQACANLYVNGPKEMTVDTLANLLNDHLLGRTDLPR